MDPSNSTAPIVGIVARLAEVYDKSLSVEALSAYAEDLAAYPIWDIQTVAGQLRKTSEHWPRIPAWIEALKAIKSARENEYRPPEAGIYCPDCGDNGYISYICSDSGPCQRCRERGRMLTGVVQRDPTTDLPLKDEHGKPIMAYLDLDHHSYARPCHCRSQNPSINGSRRRENEATSGPAPRPRRKQSW